MLTSIIAAIVILGLLIIVHEFGHFIVAKRSGVRVLRFSIGFPPKIIGFRRGGTEYQIGATPFGGYVRMLGDEIADELGAEDVRNYLKEVASDLVQAAGQRSAAALERGDVGQQIEALSRRATVAQDHTAAAEIFGRPLRPDERILIDEVARLGAFERALTQLGDAPPSAVLERIQQTAFPTQSIFKRVAIVLAGPLANIVFAPVLLTIVFMYGVPRLLPVIGQLKKGLPAEAAGLRAGDRITAIGGKAIKTWEELSQAVKQSNGAALSLELERGPSRISLTVRPAEEKENNAFGEPVTQWVIGVLPSGEMVLHRVGPLGAVGHALTETGKMTVTMVVGIAKIIEGTAPLRQSLGGPIMIAQIAGREAHEGFANVALFTVMLSIELGIINLFPVPMLDGGHLLFFLVEGLRGKPLKVRHREIAQQVGLLLIVVLMAFAVFNDISRIVKG